MADVMKAELAGLLFQWRDEAFVQADGRAAFPADNVVMVVVRLFREVERFSFENEALDQAGLPQGFQNSIHRGSVADLGSDLGVNLLGGEGRGGLVKDFQDCAAAGGRL